MSRQPPWDGNSNLVQIDSCRESRVRDITVRCGRVRLAWVHLGRLPRRRCWRDIVMVGYWASEVHLARRRPQNFTERLRGGICGRTLTAWTVAQLETSAPPDKRRDKDSRTGEEKKVNGSTVQRQSRGSVLGKHTQPAPISHPQ